MEAAIPVDLTNPGQVFACLGLLEASEILLGDAEGGFDWSDPTHVTFRLKTAGEQNAVAAVLEFLAEATPRRFAPLGYVDPPPKKGKNDAGADDEDGEGVEGDESVRGVIAAFELSDTFPTMEGDRMALPIHIGGGNRPTVELGHWADGSSRNSFKLYAGNRSADRIARAMLSGVRGKAGKGKTIGELKSKGIQQLWEESKDDLISRPFDVLTPMGGSFNFDPRGAWTAIDAGYSLNDLKHLIAASPVVEFLAAWGMENARPDEYETREVRYAAWGMPLPLALARPALAGTIKTIPLKRFRFELALSGKNKVVTFAEMEIP
jgi:CRISPR-associated protein Csx14